MESTKLTIYNVQRFIPALSDLCSAQPLLQDIEGTSTMTNFSVRVFINTTQRHFSKRGQAQTLGATLTDVFSFTQENVVDLYSVGWGTRWSSWLRHCATTSRFRFPTASLEFFISIDNPSGSTKGPGLTQPLTEISKCKVVPLQA
jgi:hypothetical protein